MAARCPEPNPHQPSARPRGIPAGRDAGTDRTGLAARPRTEHPAHPGNPDPHTHDREPRRRRRAPRRRNPGRADPPFPDSLACELQRDWGRTETVADIVEIVLTSRLLKDE